jgi:DNA-binding CsgD family transcriptional regulator
MLRGRLTERATLDRLLDALRGGESGVLVVRGEPGVGKSALLEYAVGSASGIRVARAAGVESEMELAFAALHQLCAPMLDRLDRLPNPQRDALATAFGSRAGEAPDRFLVGLATLNLLSEAADEQPLLCVVDDAQWLDRASAQALAFVARRLLAESVALVFAARGRSEELRGLPKLALAGLGDADARSLLASVITGPLDERVRERFLAETYGNPLALLELPRGVPPAALAGGFGVPGLPLSARIEEAFRRRFGALPAATRLLMLVAAAEPLGEPALVWRAAERLGIGVEAATPAADADLLELGARARFRHPLVRSAVYQGARLEERQRVHGALADATDPEVDPDRRAWHRAHATPGPDEDVAAELERSAGRAQARGGLAAAAALLEQAAVLTPDPARRTERALAGAQAKHHAGAPDAALALLATAAGPLNRMQAARSDLLRAQIAFTSSRSSDAPTLLLDAAKQFEPLDAELARETYIEAFTAAIIAGRLATGGGVREVAQALRTAPPPPHPRAIDRVLDGVVRVHTEGYAVGSPALKRALDAFLSEELTSDEELRWLWLAGHAATQLWDDESWHELADRHVRTAREVGALSVLPIALVSRIALHVLAGDFAEAASLLEEAEGLSEETGGRLAVYIGLALAAWRGREPDVSELIEDTMREVVARGDGIGLGIAGWARAVLGNGLGQYDDAFSAAARHDEYPYGSPWVAPELIEAAARSGKTDSAADALRRLSEMTRASGSDWGLGIAARSRALLSEGEAAERLYREAIDRLGRTRIRPELARAHLLYGEWLRREGRRVRAREQLRIAHEMLTGMGADGFADRAARELQATGETARKRTAATAGDLTAQEAQIARLARDGLTNPEIGTRLFISARTVQYHLRKVFAKLDISSRNELHRVLPAEQKPGRADEAHAAARSPPAREPTSAATRPAS